MHGGHCAFLQTHKEKKMVPDLKDQQSHRETIRMIKYAMTGAWWEARPHAQEHGGGTHPSWEGLPKVLEEKSSLSQGQGIAAGQAGAVWKGVQAEERPLLKTRHGELAEGHEGADCPAAGVPTGWGLSYSHFPSVSSPALRRDCEVGIRK